MSVDDPNKEELKCGRCGYHFNPEESCRNCGWCVDGNGFTEVQGVILRAYCGGEYTGLLPTSLESGVGDGLFEFLMDELGPSEDCNDLETAIERIETIQDQVSQIHAALHGMICPSSADQRHNFLKFDDGQGGFRVCCSLCDKDR